VDVMNGFDQGHLGQGALEAHRQRGHIFGLTVTRSSFTFAKSKWIGVDSRRIRPDRSAVGV